ncbi:carbohydrate ABC transporter permease [Microbispora sp. ATCC PTA-5024]|uniref:carbohydrate ABC transporter permease n=1 Tax=Microbispora sp. ATCC PTA-5024 TaxID=316330 RepID=UPI0003DC931D|nr:sugar ABC transporter permease [Microbispora sp. ATCC PTA-5024]ETK32194.1 spermidine/putrescine ABC transporter permease [Microbispora sp. ATCC PTA-5024]
MAHRPPGRPETRWAYVFLLPWLIGLVLFQAGPMVASLVLSLTDYDLISPPKFVGLGNYAQMAQDPKVARAIANTAFYTVLHVPLAAVIALALALMLNRVTGRAAGVFRTVFYLPSMTPYVAVGVLFLFLLNGQAGLVNQFLGLFGIDGPQWTTDPAWVKPGIVLMSLWNLGSTTIILFAALRNVPRELHEAAMIDGAGAWQRFRSVTVPMISSALFFVVIINTISSVQMFDQVYTMFFGNQSAQHSYGDAALFYVVYLFQQGFQFLHMGYASALAWVLFLIILVITVIQVKVGNRFVYYEAEPRGSTERESR